MKQNRSGFLAALLAGVTVAVLSTACNRPAPAPAPAPPTEAAPAPPAAPEAPAASTAPEAPAPTPPVVETAPPEAAPPAAPPETPAPPPHKTAHPAPKPKPKHLAAISHKPKPAEVPPAAVPPPPPPETTAEVVVAGRKARADLPSRRVKLGDLDLASKTGACTALKRITSAAEEVCPFEDNKELPMQAERRRCVEESVSRAIQDTHSSQLATLHSGRGC